MAWQGGARRGQARYGEAGSNNAAAEIDKAR